MADTRLKAETLIGIAKGADGVRVPMSIIKRDRKTMKIHSVDISKRFRRTITKRLLRSDWSTRPYGWVENQEDRQSNVFLQDI